MTRHAPTSTVAARPASQIIGTQPAGTADPLTNAESADVFQQIDAGLAQGAVDLNTYEDCRSAWADVGDPRLPARAADTGP